MRGKIKSCGKVKMAYFYIGNCTYNGFFELILVCLTCHVFNSKFTVETPKKGNWAFYSTLSFTPPMTN